MIELLSRKTEKENIRWYRNEPIFVIPNMSKENKIIAMDMNAEVKEYGVNDVSDGIIIGDEYRGNRGIDIAKEFENYLEKIVRSSRIFQSQHYNSESTQRGISKQADEAKKKYDRCRSATIDLTNEIGRMQEQQKALIVM